MAARICPTDEQLRANFAMKCREWLREAKEQKSRAVDMKKRALEMREHSEEMTKPPNYVISRLRI